MSCDILQAANTSRSEDFLRTWMMVEQLKQEGISHSFRDLLIICVKIGASWSAEALRQVGGSTI